MFESLHRDARGRVGRLKIKEYVLETPLVLPVVNPNISAISASELKEMGFSSVITNSYIIYKSEALREKALKSGVKGLLGFDGAVMTDSGSYQLYQYGQIDVSPDEIVDFQQSIGSDIGVILDIPTPPQAIYSDAKRDLEETQRRAKSSLSLKKEMLLAGTIQGSTFLDLREAASKSMAELKFDIYPIGGVVPLMESYRFSELAKIILTSKEYIPSNKPVHLFGAGHPMIFALAVALGCDIFDSAAYYLYARDGRYITSSGTLKLEDMRGLPCECPICSSYTAEDVRMSEDRDKLLAKHNLYVILREIMIIKEAIFRGTLWELVERRCRAHPTLLNALRVLRGFPLEAHEPLTKKTAFFYSGPESLYRPEVKRHTQRLARINSPAKTLVLYPHWKMRGMGSFGSNKDYQVAYLSPVFGVIPAEIGEVYPLGQHIYPENLDKSQQNLIKNAANDYSKNFEKVMLHTALTDLGIKGEVVDILDLEADVSIKMEAMGDYQFGKGAGKALFEGCVGKYSRTGRLRRIIDNETLVATVRASDGIIVPSLEGAKRLLKLEPPKNRVTIEDDEVAQFIKDGRSVFCKFIKGCDSEIVPYSEVIIVNSSDELLNWGRTLLGGDELVEFDNGVGVKTRGKI